MNVTSNVQVTGIGDPLIMFKVLIGIICVGVIAGIGIWLYSLMK